MSDAEYVQYEFRNFHKLMPMGEHWWNHYELTHDLENVLNSIDEDAGLPLDRGEYQTKLKRKFELEKTHDDKELSKINAALNKMLRPIVDKMEKRGYSRENLLNGMPHHPTKRLPPHREPL